ncbi:hypothetical protein ETD83_32990 [Actinomadura soli]|uniref:ATP-grasp domain-containing protein n=1 Tax=Actinomadura soli TaxID=2508997 RepID=A0A5C4J3S6_9ACTN|nr:hypothetical protein [Actinomadura soli]TMQ90994.1 hypothetical protein ETD83_32990 [Actinomadura soli]
MDWRSDYDALSYAEFDLPEDTRHKLVELHRRLGLVVGAVDLIRDTEGRDVLLETNQVGERGWISEEIGSPIAAAIADELTRSPQ